MLVESLTGADTAVGRADHQGPEVDGVTRVGEAGGVRVGDLVPARVVGSDGADLLAVPIGASR